MVEHLAHRYAAWHDQAKRTHQLLRDIVLSAEVTDFGDGLVTVRVSAGSWRAAQLEANNAAPEPPTAP